MRKLFEPAIRIPGCKRVDKVRDGYTFKNKDGTVIQEWKHPHPLGFVYHWKNAATKLKHIAKPMSEWEANKAKWFKAVPIHEGFDNRLLRYMVSQLNYANKLAHPMWAHTGYVGSQGVGTYRKPYKAPPDLRFDKGSWVRV